MSLRVSTAKVSGEGEKTGHSDARPGDDNECSGANAELGRVLINRRVQPLWECPLSPPEADMLIVGINVCFVPLADVRP
jgi:hypothetical protein